MSGRVRTSIALQIRHLRENSDISQSDLAGRIGTHQSAISRLENTDYGRASVQTLLDIAVALDVALVVRFVSYDEFLGQHGDVSPASLSAETFSQTYERYVGVHERSPISPGLMNKITERASANATPGFLPDTGSSGRKNSDVGIQRNFLVVAEIGSQEGEVPLSKVFVEKSKNMPAEVLTTG